MKVKFFVRSQSYNKEFSDLEKQVNVFIHDLEQSGGKVLDVKLQTNAQGDGFAWVMMTVVVMYEPPERLMETT